MVAVWDDINLLESVRSTRRFFSVLQHWTFARERKHNTSEFAMMLLSTWTSCSVFVSCGTCLRSCTRIAQVLSLAAALRRDPGGVRTLKKWKSMENVKK